MQFENHKYWGELERFIGAGIVQDRKCFVWSFILLRLSLGKDVKLTKLAKKYPASPILSLSSLQNRVTKLMLDWILGGLALGCKINFYFRSAGHFITWIFLFTALYLVQVKHYGAEAS